MTQHCSYFLTIAAVIISSSKSHITLVFPPPRRQTFSFQNNFNLQLPCGGKTKENSRRTTFIAGSDVTIQWSSTENFKSDFTIEIWNTKPLVAISSSSYSTSYDSSKYHYQVDINLPPDFSCKDCFIRVLIQHVGTQPNLTISSSCADIEIIPYMDILPYECRFKELLKTGRSETNRWSDFIFKKQRRFVTSLIQNTTKNLCSVKSLEKYTCYKNKCLNNGICRAKSGQCSCPKFYSGDRCEVYNERIKRQSLCGEDEGGEFSQPINCNKTLNSFSCLYRILYSYFNDTHLKFIFQFQNDVPKWVGFGISPDGRMTSSDILMAANTGNDFIINDSYAVERAKVFSDTDLGENNDAKDLSVTLHNSQTVINMEFFRLRDTRSQLDRGFDDVNSCWFLLFAAGPMNGSEPIMHYPGSVARTSNKRCLRKCLPSLVTYITFNFAVVLEDGVFTVDLVNDRSDIYLELRSNLEISLQQSYEEVIKDDRILKTVESVKILNFQASSGVLVNYEVTIGFLEFDGLDKDILRSELQQMLASFVERNNNHLPGINFIINVLERKPEASTEKVYFASVNKQGVSALIFIGIIASLVFMFEISKAVFKTRGPIVLKNIERNSKRRSKKLTPLFNDINLNKINEKVIEIKKKKKEVPKLFYIESEVALNENFVLNYDKEPDEIEYKAVNTADPNNHPPQQNTNNVSLVYDHSESDSELSLSQMMVTPKPSVHN